MFAVKVLIDTDGEFKFQDPELNPKEGRPHVFYFENREGAAAALSKSLRNLTQTFRTDPTGSRDIEEWLDYFTRNISDILEKVPTFILAKDFGGPEISYELVETEKKENTNGSFSFTEKPAHLDLSCFTTEELNRINWKDIPV